MHIPELSLTERKGQEVLLNTFKELSNVDYVHKLINVLPNIGAILNGARQTVYVNRSLLEFLGIKTFDRIIGKRPGEIVNCVNYKKGPDGCGTSKNCVVCGAYNSIIESQLTSEVSTKECRITAHEGTNLIAYDFKVTSTPFNWNNEQFTIFSLVDISSDKRRRNLERIFFHDVLNKTSSIYGFLDLIKMEDDKERIDYFLNLLSTLNNDLTDEIKAQQELMAAENKELSVHLGSIESTEILESAKGQIMLHEVANGKEIVISDNTESFALETDGVLLRRILMNMIKNALEASSTNDIVTLGAQEFEDHTRFWVHNPLVIPEEVKLQIFQRSFSTKGISRGIGTYSMKLLGENYLKGNVDFTSEQGEGTKFFIDLPK